MAAPQWTCPTANDETLADNLNSILQGSMAVTVRDVAKPNQLFVQTVYTSILQNNLGMNVCNIMQVPSSLITRLDYPEAFSDALPLHRLAAALRNLLRGLGVPDFTVLDITNPKPRRTARVLSQLINFVNFVAMRMNKLQVVVSGVGDMKREREQLEKKVDDLMSEINHRKARQAEQEIMLAEDRDNNAALLEKLQRLQLEKEELQKRVKAEKVRAAEIKTKQEELNIAVLKVQKDRQDLESKVVQHPDKAKKMLTEKQRVLSELQAQAEALCNKFGSKEDGFNSLNLSIDMLKKIQQHTTRIAEDLDEIKSVDHEVKEIEEKKADFNTKLCDLRRAGERAHQDVSLLTEWLTRLQLQSQKLKTAKEEEVAHREAVLEGLRRRATEEEIVASSLAAEEAALGRELTALQEEEVEFSRQIHEKYASVLESIDSYNDKLEKLICPGQ